MTGKSHAPTEDFRWRAADVVMRKSLAAAERYAAQMHALESYRHGLLDEDPGAAPDEAIIAETHRALEQAVAALEKWGEE